MTLTFHEHLSWILTCTVSVLVSKTFEIQKNTIRISHASHLYS